MFWGLQMEPNLRYSQQVPEGFRITKATLSTDKPPARAKDPAGKLVQVFVDQDGNEYAIATLKHGEIYDCSLDLRFAEGEDICFYLKGDGIVFLTGHNLYPDDPNDETFCLRSDAISDTSSEEDLEVDDCDEDADGPEIEDITERASKVKRNSLKPSNGIAEKKSVEAESSEEDEEDDDEDDLDSMDESDSMDENEEDEDESDEDENESAADQDEEEDAKGTTAPGSKRPDSFLRKISPDPKKPKLRSPSPTSQPRQNGHASQSAKRAEGGDKKESVKELVVKDIKVGSGPVAKKGKTVRVYYVGKLLNGKTFDQVTNGPPFQFKLGTASVIQGWDKGLEGMRVGGKRRLIIPSSLAYGKQKMGPIPAGSALQFEIELKAIV